MSSNYGFKPGQEAEARVKAAEEATRKAAEQARDNATRAKADPTARRVLTEYAKAQGVASSQVHFDERDNTWSVSGSSAQIQLVPGEEAQLKVNEQDWKGQGALAASALSREANISTKVNETSVRKLSSSVSDRSGNYHTNYFTESETKEVATYNPDGTVTKPKTS